MINQPLYLPKGSVRAILILILTFFIILCILLNKDINDGIITVWAGMIGYYFWGKNIKL